MKTQRGVLRLLLIIMLVANFVSARDEATQNFINAIDNMIGGDIDTSTLIEYSMKFGNWGSREETPAQMAHLPAIALELRFPGPLGAAIPPISIFPYQRIKPLMFCTTCKVTSLTFNNNITPGLSTVSAQALVATKANGRVTILQASGSAAAMAKKQYLVTQVHKCDQIWFVSFNCRHEDVYTERGIQPHELDTILSKLQREAAGAMKEEVLAKVGMRSSELHYLYSSLYLDESNKLRTLYPEIEYDYSELDLLPEPQFKEAVAAASLGHIADDSVLERMLLVARSAARSSFIMVPQPTVFYVAAVDNLSNGNFRLRFSTFRVQGRLPSGAFVTSTGAWATERAGEGAVPSLAQIIAIFPALKA